MKFFFETETTVDELVKETIEEMASILICKDEIVVICEKCGLFLSTQPLKYKVYYYYYPGRVIESNEIIDCNVCNKCSEKIKNGT